MAQKLKSKINLFWKFALTCANVTRIFTQLKIFSKMKIFISNRGVNRLNGNI